MARILCQKLLGSLRPIDDAGKEALSKIGNGEIVAIELRKPRNIKFHRCYWALVSLVWDNIDHERYPSAEDLHAAIKIGVGLRTRIELPDGTVGFIPGSTAFHKMDDIEFGKFFDKVCNLIAKHWLPGVTQEELRHEVELMIGAAA